MLPESKMGFEDLEKLMDSEIEVSRDGDMKSQPVKPQVMVVDDDPHLLEAMTALLEDKYDLVLCKNGEEALAKVDSAIHAVLLDIKMSGMNGFEVFRRIKNKFNHLPIIFHTAHQDSFDPYDVLNKLRPYGYLQKGQDEERLLAVLARAVRYRMKFLQSEIKLAELIQERRRLEEEIKARNEKLADIKNRVSGTLSFEKTAPKIAKILEGGSLLGLGEVLVTLKRALREAAETRAFLSFSILEVNDAERIREKVGPSNFELLIENIVEVLEETTDNITGRMGNFKLAIIMPGSSDSSAREHIARVQKKLTQAPFSFHDQHEINFIPTTTSAAVITVREKTAPEARSVIFAAEKTLARTRRPNINTCAVETLDTDR